MKVIDNLTVRESTDVIAADKLIGLKKKSGDNPWPVIEEILTIWATKHPNEWQSFLVHIDNVRQTRKDKKFGSTYDKKHGGYLRYTLDIPQQVMLMIRTLYDHTELKMDRRFFIEFARRFPRLKVAEKL